MSDINQIESYAWVDSEDHALIAVRKLRTVKKGGIGIVDGNCERGGICWGLSLLVS
jgi:hypothetical protein